MQLRGIESLRAPASPVPASTHEWRIGAVPRSRLTPCPNNPPVTGRNLGATPSVGRRRCHLIERRAEGLGRHASSRFALGWFFVEAGGKTGRSLASPCALKISSILSLRVYVPGATPCDTPFPSYGYSRGRPNARCPRSVSLRSTAARRNCAAALAVSIPPLGAQRARPPGGRYAGRWQRREGAELRREDKIVVGPSCR